MAVSLRKGFCIPGSGATAMGNSSKKKRPLARNVVSSSLEVSTWKGECQGKQVVLRDPQPGRDGPPAGDHAGRSIHVQAAPVCIPRSMRWWEKGNAANMMEIGSAQELVDSLLNAGDRLVVLDFYSPGCGGCKALHPKICQLADSNPGGLFLKINYEQHKSMCYSLNVHVLPFFRFYRGSQGRVCSFSCTIATINKFKDALAKHGAEEDDRGPARGLEEWELMKLASSGDLHLDLGYAPLAPGGFPEVEGGLAALTM